MVPGVPEEYMVAPPLAKSSVDHGLEVAPAQSACPFMHFCGPVEQTNWGVSRRVGRRRRGRRRVEGVLNKVPVPLLPLMGCIFLAPNLSVRSADGLRQKNGRQKNEGTGQQRDRPFVSRAYLKPRSTASRSRHRNVELLYRGS